MTQYQWDNPEQTVVKVTDGDVVRHIPVDPDNRDWAEEIKPGIAAGSIVVADYVLPLTPYRVPTYTIVRRLEDLKLIDRADAALASNKVLWRRFYTVGDIDPADADARAFLAAIGADPNVILARE